MSRGGHVSSFFIFLYTLRHVIKMIFDNEDLLNAASFILMPSNRANMLKFMPKDDPMKLVAELQ
jgi:hypothetical protein